MACAFCRHFKHDPDRNYADAKLLRGAGFCLRDPVTIKVAELHSCGSFCEREAGVMGTALGNWAEFSDLYVIERNKRLALEKRVRAMKAAARS